MKRLFQKNSKFQLTSSLGQPPPHSKKNAASGERLAKRRLSKRKADFDLRRLATVVQDSNDAVTILDFSGNILAWNHGAECMYGYQELEALSMNVRKIIPDSKWKAARDFMQSIAKGDVIQSHETQRLTKDGRMLDVWLTVTVLLDGEGKPEAIATTERDITIRKEMERVLKEQVNKLAERTRELLDANEQLKRHNEELDKFACIASHDLKSPLRTIRGASELLTEHLKSDGVNLQTDARKLLELIQSSSKRMDALISGLLEHSRISRIKVQSEEVDLHSVVDEVIDNLTHTIHGCSASITIEKLPVVVGNRMHLTQLLQNLIDNALKFRSQCAPEIKLSSSETPTHWVIMVRDNGIGIPKQQQKDIFRAFKRVYTDKKYEGIGLGLATCKKIVEQHRGTIFVESEEQKGSTFYFTLPRKVDLTEVKQTTCSTHSEQPL